MLPKVKPMVPSYVPLRTIQLLFETFFHIYHSFRKILMHYLKWDTLYTRWAILIDPPKYLCRYATYRNMVRIKIVETMGAIHLYY